MIYNYISLVPEHFLICSFFLCFSYCVYYYLNFNNEYFLVYNYSVYSFLVSIFFFLFFIVFSFGFEFGVRDFFFREDLAIIFEFFLLVFFSIFLLSTFNFIFNLNYSVVEIYTFFFLCILGIALFFHLEHIISFYLVMEFISFCFYILTAFLKKNMHSFEGGLKYFILSSFSSIVLLFGFSLVYGFSGCLYIGDLFIFFYNITFVENINFFVNDVFVFSFICIILGMLFKLYAFPFHFWVSDIYQNAPFISTFFFSIVTFFPFYYFLYKLYLNVFIFFDESLYSAFVFLSVGSMFIGSIGAIQQKKVRKMIAYSSISVTGYYLTYFFVSDILLVRNIFFFIVVYVLSLFGIWMYVTNLKFLSKNFFLERISLYSGLMNYQYFSSLIFLGFFFALGGLPPFPNFIAKVSWLVTLMYNSFYFLVGIVLFVTLLSFFFYIRVGKNVVYNSNIYWFLLINFDYLSSFFFILIFILINLLVFKPGFIFYFIEYGVI